MEGTKKIATKKIALKTIVPKELNSTNDNTIDNIIEDMCEANTKNKIECNGCHKMYSDSDSLRKHINQNRCKGNTATSVITQPVFIPNLQFTVIDSKDVVNHLQQQAIQLKVMQDQISELHKMVGIHLSANRNPTVILLKDRDDLLKILVDQMQMKNALAFIMDCGIHKLNGHCMFLQTIYFPADKNPAITWATSNHTQYVYYNEDINRIIEKNGNVIAEKMAINLSICYQKTLDILVNPSTGNIINDDKNHSLLPCITRSDVNTIRNELLHLRDPDYQIKLLDNMRVPLESNNK
jgi:hypothetical protein